MFMSQGILELHKFFIKYGWIWYEDRLLYQILCSVTLVDSQAQETTCEI